MSELLISYKQELVSLCRFFTLPFFAFLISLGVVCLFGRMLELVENYRIKNFLAAFSLLCCYILYFHTIEIQMPLNEKYGI